jgi:hypothetical protein
MEKVFENIGVISNFNDFRFLIDKMETYINELEQTNNNCHLDCCHIDELENDIEQLDKTIGKLYSDIYKLKDRLKWFILGCERVIRENKLSKDDLDNLSSLINSGNDLIHDLD